YSYRERAIGIEENKFEAVFQENIKTIYFKKDLIYSEKDYSIFNSLGEKLNKEKIRTGIYFIIPRNKKAVKKIIILR
ncbi:MAG: hypothetical protein ABIK90_05520, partial [candidate division WOR-3 bacterium]